MDSPGYIALSRLIAQQRAVDVISNNVANSETPGFKSNRMVFSEVLVRQRSVASPPGSDSLSFTQDRATWRDVAQGQLHITTNPLDVALAGEGYFSVETTRGERFTRAGHFSIAQDGRLVDIEGNAVLDTSSRPIVLGATDSRIDITGDGVVRSENGPVGRIKVVRFANQQNLSPEGSRLFRADNMTPEAVDQPRVVQGSIEGSNVSSIGEMTRLLEVSKEFEQVAHFVDAEGQRISGAVDKILGHRG